MPTRPPSLALRAAVAVLALAALAVAAAPASAEVPQSFKVIDGFAAKGHAVDKRKIELEHPIKTIGHHTVPIRLHHEVMAEVRLTVVAE